MYTVMIHGNGYYFQRRSFNLYIANIYICCSDGEHDSGASSLNYVEIQTANCLSSLYIRLFDTNTNSLVNIGPALILLREIIETTIIHAIL